MQINSPVSLQEVQDLTEMENLLFKEDEFQIVPFKEYQRFNLGMLVLFGHKHALYTFPTTELIDFLRIEIGDMSAIEVCAGKGIIGKALGIPCTDSFLQDRPDVRKYYEELGQPPIAYGGHVIKEEANDSVRERKPECVIGSWVTAKWDNELKKGNYWGPDDRDFLKHCKKYIHIGNQYTHDWKPITLVSHRTVREPWIVSRSVKPDGNYIQIWTV